MSRLLIVMHMAVLLALPSISHAQTTDEVRKPKLKCVSKEKVTANGKEIRGQAASGVYGACPVTEVAPFNSVSGSPFDYNMWNVLVDAVDPADGVPWRYKPVFARSNLNVAGSALGDVTSIARLAGDDKCEDTRVACGDKIYDKGTNPCLWYTEVMQIAAMDLFSDSTRGFSPGRNKVVAGLPDVVCKQQDNIVQEKEPYRNQARGLKNPMAKDGDNLKAGDILASSFKKLGSADGFKEGQMFKDMHKEFPYESLFLANDFNSETQYAGVPGVGEAKAAPTKNIYDFPFDLGQRTEHQPKDLMKKLFPDAHKLLSNDNMSHFLAGREWQGLKDFGNKMPFGKGFDASYATKPFQDMLEKLKGKSLTDLQLSRYKRINDPTNAFSPFDKLLMYPVDLHYSAAVNPSKASAKAAARMGGSAAAKGSGNVKIGWNFQDYPKGWGKDYSNDVEHAVRCSGNKRAEGSDNRPDKFILTNLLVPRYGKGHNSIMKRITFNRLCKANDPVVTPPWCKGRSSKGLEYFDGKETRISDGLCSGCWTNCCWRDNINSERPPARTNWNAARDPAMELAKCIKCPPWINDHPVTPYIDKVHKEIGIDYEPGWITERIEKVCDDIAKPMPLLNNKEMCDIRELYKRGETLKGPELTFFGQFSDSRPYPALPTTGKEMKERRWKPSGGKPPLLPGAEEYWADRRDGYYGDGAYVGLCNYPANKPDPLVAQVLPETEEGVDRLSYASAILGLLEARAAPSGGGLKTVGPSFGGVGDMAGKEGCPSSAAHPMFGALAGEILLQHRTKHELGYSCEPHEGRQMGKGVAAMVADLGSAAINILAKDAEGKDTGIQITMPFTDTYRGWIFAQDASQAFPNGGGGEKPTMKTGIEKMREYIDDPEKDPAGAIVVLEKGGAPSSPAAAARMGYASAKAAGGGGAVDDGKPGMRTAVVVSQVGENFFDAYQTNIGLWPDALGNNSGSGGRVLRRFYKEGTMPQAYKDMYAKIKVPTHCAVAAQSSGVCELDNETWENTQWFHPADMKYPGDEEATARMAPGSGAAAKAGGGSICDYDRTKTYLIEPKKLFDAIAKGDRPCRNWLKKGGYSINTGGTGSVQMGELIKPFTGPPMNAMQPVTGTGDNTLNLQDLLRQLGGLLGGGAMGGGAGGLNGVFNNAQGENGDAENTAEGFGFAGPDIKQRLTELDPLYPAYDLLNIGKNGFDLTKLETDTDTVATLFPAVTNIPVVPIASPDHKMVSCEVVLEISVIPRPLYELCRYYVDLSEHDFTVID